MLIQNIQKNRQKKFQSFNEFGFDKRKSVRNIAMEKETSAKYVEK